MYLPVIARLRRQHGLVTYRQLQDAGLASRDVRRLLAAGHLVRVRHGVYAEATAWDALDPFREQPLLRVRAVATCLTSAHVVFSHDSAAIALGMGAPSPSTALVHVTRRKVHGDAQRAGVKHHLAPYLPGEVVKVEGLPVLAPARTALDMAREHGRIGGLAACDAALRLGATRTDLGATLGRMHCWPGSTTMRWCVEMADAGAESYLESQGRDLVLELGIGRPETQFGLGDGSRTVWCDLRVDRHVFEVDGHLKYDADNLTGQSPRLVLRQEKQRQDFITGFKLGASRITAHDCGPGRRAALDRLAREYADTCRRFGTATDDLTPYVVTRRRQPTAG